ncbi:ligand-gated channel [Geothermobacter hydrogeniphilus]|uniref:Ligand-gated channel n=2 Tax=Geothermobacter hydrogeniphilus TaxID=1969733 RepID=A0A1X0Y5Y9_9BACT|nr:ligand-gated channel [Geothermobacter hydrogeniphilus]
MSGLLLVTLFMVPVTGRAETTLLDEITVRGQRQSSQQESLTIREVRESPARDIGEALQAVPGLSSVRKGAIANDIVLRGLMRDNINVFLDGVRLQGGCPSRMDPPSFHFDFAEVESIEIIKGPYDLANPGSMGGMINAVPRAPGEGPGFRANLSYGSDNYLDSSLVGSYGGETLDGLLGYAYKTSDIPESGDGKRLTEIYPATSPNRYRPEAIDSKAYEINTLWTRGGYKLAKGRSEISYAYQDADHVLYPYLLMDADYDRTHRVNWTTRLHNLSANLTALNFQAWYNRVEHRMDDSLRESSRPSMMVTRPAMMLTDAETMTAGAKLNGDFRLGPGTLSGGIDIYRRNWDATNESAMWMSYDPQPMIPDVDIDNLGAFAEYSWPLTGSLTLKGGARLDYTEVKAKALSATRLAGLYQPYFAPGIAADTDFTEPGGNLQLTWQATDQLEIFTGAASVSRPPDQQELYIGLQRTTGQNWLGNPNLGASRNTQVDFGAKWSGETLFASVSLFYSRISDFIYITEQPDPDGTGPLIQARTYRNVDARFKGGELSGQASLPFDLFLQGSLSYVRAENDDSNRPLAEIPPLNGRLALRYDNGDWFVEATERFADRQNRVDPDLQEEETAGWAVTDVKAGADWNRWSLTGGVNNIFDRFYFSHLSYQRDPFSSGVKVPETGLFAYATLAFHY